MSDEIALLEFWECDRMEWRRVPSLEGPLYGDTDNPSRRRYPSQYAQTIGAEDVYWQLVGERDEAQLVELLRRAGHYDPELAAHVAIKLLDSQQKRKAAKDSD